MLNHDNTTVNNNMLMADLKVCRDNHGSKQVVSAAFLVGGYSLYMNKIYSSFVSALLPNKLACILSSH